MTKLPKELFYNKDNTWVKADKDIAVLGVVGPAVKKVKEFVFVKLPEKGKHIKKGDVYISIESIKWSGHLPSPVSGKVIEVNNPLYDEPSKINKDPYGSWVCKIKMEDKDELKELMDNKEAGDFYN